MTPISDYTEAVRKARPLLNELINEFGELSVLDFANHLFQRGEMQSQIFRPEFINLLSLTFPETPKDIINQFDISLRKNPIVSTADHHSIINHPVYLNSNILLSLFARNFSQEKLPIVSPPVLSFSAIPLNNNAFPKGILLATSEGEKRFSFFGSKQRHQAVCLTEPLSFSEKQINTWLKYNSESFTKDELAFIGKMILNLSSTSEINSCQTFAEQTKVFNDWLWEKIFPGSKLCFFPIEKLTKYFFSKILIKEKSLPLYKFFFDFPLSKQNELFNGIYGAWDLIKIEKWQAGGGTSFFWGTNKEKRIIPLKRVSSILIAEDESFKPIKWNPQDLAYALEEERIIPSILTDYLVIAGHYGLCCSGGFNQIGYLTPILKQYQKALLEISKEESQRVEKIITDVAHMILYFLFGEDKNKVVPLCSFNILQAKEELDSIESILNKVKLKKAFEITAPLIFPFIVEPKVKEKMGFSFQEVFLQLKNIMPEELIIQKW